MLIFILGFLTHGSFCFKGDRDFFFIVNIFVTNYREEMLHKVIIRSHLSLCIIYFNLGKDFEHLCNYDSLQAIGGCLRTFILISPWFISSHFSTFTKICVEWIWGLIFEWKSF